MRAILSSFSVHSVVASRWVVFDQGTGERRYELSCCSETATQKMRPFVAHRQSYAIVDSFGILNTMGLTLSQRACIFFPCWELSSSALSQAHCWHRHKHTSLASPYAHYQSIFLTFVMIFADFIGPVCLHKKSCYHIPKGKSQVLCTVISTLLTYFLL